MTIAHPDSATTLKDTPVTIDVLANDVGTNLTLIGITSPSHGSIAVNAGQTITFTPGAGFVGVDSFTYTIRGQNQVVSSAEVTITVQQQQHQNQPPVANDDQATTLRDTPVVIDILANDHDPDGGPLQLVALVSPDHGQVTLNPDKTLTYTPHAGFVGTDSFGYTIADPSGAADSATVTVTVEDVPVVVGDPWSDGTLFTDDTGWVS